MNHETKIRNQGVYNCALCGNEIVVPIDESAGLTQEFVDENCPQCSHSNVVHIKIDGGSNVQAWVKGHSHDEQKDLPPHTRR